MIKIITDSSANISQQEAEEWGITVLPLTIIFGGKEYRDGVDLFAEVFYQMLTSSDEFPHTAQISEEQLTKAYTEACADGSDVIVMPISCGLSGSYDLCRSIAQRQGFERVHVYNTRCTTIPLRILVEEAVKNKDKPIDEVIAILDELRPRIKLFAALDTLEYLKKGGRISGAVAAVGSLLKIKPIIIINPKGGLDMVSKSLGMHKAINYLAEKVNGADLDTRYKVTYIYTMNDVNARSAMAKTSAGEDNSPVNMCPVIGAHIGPCAAGVVYVVKK